MSKSVVLPFGVRPVTAIGEIGPYHADVEGDTETGGVRGPFTTSEVQANTVPTYPVLWSHDAEKEYCLCFEADREGQVRQGATQEEQEAIDLKAANVWATASHCHFNQNFQFNSQATAMQFTSRPTIGGRAWPSISLDSANLEKALVLWGNTSLGLLIHWYYANKQQAGRGNITRSVLEELPILNIESLDSKTLNDAVKLFDKIGGTQFLPIHEIDKDAVRANLDVQFLRDVLGLPDALFKANGPVDVLRKKLSLEPSIRGAK